MRLVQCSNSPPLGLCRGLCLRAPPAADWQRNQHKGRAPMRARFWILAMLALLLVLVLGAGCKREPEEQRLRRQVAELQEAISQRQAGKIEDVLAENFAGPGGMDRRDARRMAAAIFLRHRQSVCAAALWTCRCRAPAARGSVARSESVAAPVACCRSRRSCIGSTAAGGCRKGIGVWSARSGGVALAPNDDARADDKTPRRRSRRLSIDMRQRRCRDRRMTATADRIRPCRPPTRAARTATGRRGGSSRLPSASAAARRPRNFCLRHRHAAR